MERRAFGVMPVFIAGDVHELAAAAAAAVGDAIGQAIDRRGRACVMLATGNSQLAMLDHLTGQEHLDWARVVVFHMDEYVGVGNDHSAGFARYIRERVAEKVHPGEVHYIAGDTGDPEAECRRYGALLEGHHLDVCCLGIGENGHLAFNDPPVADFDDPRTLKVVDLDEACRLQQVGEGHFAGLEDVPARAITVTIPALLAAATVFAIVPEARKAEPVRASLRGPITTRCPASVLRTKANTQLYLDTESASLLA